MSAELEALAAGQVALGKASSLRVCRRPACAGLPNSSRQVANLTCLALRLPRHALTNATGVTSEKTKGLHFRAGPCFMWLDLSPNQGSKD